VPTPPADSPPNAAFIDDPATISDKQLLSPNITTVCDAGEVRLSFRNNFNLQDGFDGGVLEVSFDDGLTFQDIVAAGATFVRGGYNGTISNCCGNPLAGRQAWTGNSRGFIQTTVTLFGCSNFILRWRLAVTAASPATGGESIQLPSRNALTLSGRRQSPRRRTRAPRRRDEGRS
jgi:hypothetical protein